jgi:tetratricopeptide (TPR) repeat protein
MKCPLPFWGCLVVLLLAAISVPAQRPTLKVNDENPAGVYLKKLDINVSINGSIATTTWTMQFKNNTTRILEGELNFPLPQGINVSRYALDINGQMREAVPVEKAKGTMTFESIERRKIDPGLLEKVDGNIFRTRIYPINAGSTRTVMIGYEEELPKGADKDLKYKLPLDFDRPIDEFNISVVVKNKTAPLIGESFDGELAFNDAGWDHKISKRYIDFKPAGALSVTIPKLGEDIEVLTQQKGEAWYYLVNTSVDATEMPKGLPQHITILWDASLSCRDRDTVKEFQLLRNYLSTLKQASISLIRFSNTIDPALSFKIVDGGCDPLFAALRSTVYDGGTKLGGLDLRKMATDEILLFSEGHSTYGSDDIRLGNAPVYCINTSRRADYPALQQIALSTGGLVIDLNALTMEAAERKLRYQPLRFLGIKEEGEPDEYYPSLHVPVAGSIAIAGKTFVPGREIVLQFGYGTKVTMTKKVSLSKQQQAEGLDLARTWAQKKIAELEISYDRNKESINKLGTKYGVVTRGTSLIVLETFEDYVRYVITPPEDMRAEYDRRMNVAKSQYRQKETIALEEASEDFDRVIEWYNKDFKPAPKPKPAKPAKPVRVSAPTPANNKTATASNTTRQAETPPATATPPPSRAAVRKPLAPNSAQLSRIPSQTSEGTGAIKGTLTDETGESLIGGVVSISQNGITKNGASTDVEGGFLIKPINSGKYTLKTSYPGFKDVVLMNVPVNPGVTTIVNTHLEPNSATVLNEVVVRAYKVPLVDKHSGGGSTTIISHQLEKLPTRNTKDDGSLASGAYQAKQSNGVSLGGSRTNGTLYIIDGVQVNPFAGSNLPTVAGDISGVISDAIGFDELTISGDDEDEDVDEDEEQDLIERIRKAPREKQYLAYLEMRTHYYNRPVFFFQAAGYFLQTGRKQEGLRILSAITDLSIEDYELYKMVGYKLKEAGEKADALYIFRRIIDWRPAEPQSYRDYGLALSDAGQKQRALDTLYTALTLKYTDEINGMYEGVQEILLTEINQMVAANRRLKLPEIPEDALKALPMDIRVVLNWNMNDADVDLWVTEPGGETCKFSHNLTATGGRMSNDFTDGFGPEQFMLKRAKAGKYKIEVDYYSDHQQKLAGPVTVMAEVYTHYGTSHQTRKVITLQLDKDEDKTQLVGEFAFVN